MRYFNIILLVFGILLAVTETKKQKIVYVQASPENVVRASSNEFDQNPRMFKPLSEYDRCKMDCRKVKDALSRQEYVEQLRKELASAEDLLKQREDQTAPSRFEHLKMAASKFAETGGELKNTVLGGGTKRE